MKQLALRALPLCLTAALLGPFLLWSPFVASDSRFDGGVLCLAALGAGVCGALAGKLRWPAGAPWLVAALVLGLLPLAGAGSPVWGGLADRAPLLAGVVLVAAAAAHAPAVTAALTGFSVCLMLFGWNGVALCLGLDALRLLPAPDAPPTAPFAHTNAAAEVIAPFLALWMAMLSPSLPRRRVLATVLLLHVPLAFWLGNLGVLAARIALPAGLAWVVARERGKWLPCAVLLAALLAGEATRLALRPAWAYGAAVPAAPDAAAAAPDGAPDDAHPSLRVRWLMDRAGLARALERPLGIGLGRFEVDYPSWRPQEELRLSSANYTDPAVPRPDTPHNEPLLLLLECGLAGGLLAALGLWRLLRRRRRVHWTDPALLVLGLHALVRSPFSDNPTSLALAAVLLGWSRDADAPAAAPWARWSLAALAALAAVPAVSQIAGERALAERFRALEAGAPPHAGDLERALRWRPWDTVAADLLAVERAAAGDAGGARRALEQALRHDPADLNALTARLKLEMTAPDGDEAVALDMLARAEAVYPEHPAVRDARTRWLELQAQRQKELAGALLAQDADRGALNAVLSAHHLLLALAAVRRGEIDACRSELEQAAVLRGSDGLRLQRFARGELVEADVRAVVAELVPEYREQLGPIPAAPRPAPAR
ncbi:MAG: hypothetical protein EYC70_03255 [Planctomycetota bacterium]|nr:MAG: hypothetical protein EYC70_03255 [Planctomycetota bacterium]